MTRKKKTPETGYTACACPECFESAIGTPGKALCHACAKAGCTHAGCEVNHCEECGAWPHWPDECEGCEWSL